MIVRIIRPEPKADPTRLRFWCPGCDEIHDVRDGNNGWTYDGNAEHPTLSPSVLFQAAHKTDGTVASHRCHSYVKNGRIEFLSDCTHALAGKTVDLPTTDTWPSWASNIHS